MKRLKLALSALLVSTVVNATDHALVIGCCGQYEHLEGKNLSGTSRDAWAMADIFEQDCKKKNIKVLIESDATKENIKQELKRLKNILGKGDKLYFYFSGHGARAGDKKVFLQGITDDKDLNKRLNKTVLVTYDFDVKDTYNTAIISADDLRPVFQEMDRNGVEIIMFTDACFAGTAYKRGYVDETMKLFDSVDAIKPKQPVNHNRLYDNLISFSASLTTLQARETKDSNGEKRGEFTLYLEYCLKNADSNGDKSISKEELHQCMIDEFPSFATSSPVYPSNRLNNKSIISVATKVEAKIDKNLLKVKYSGKESLKGIASLVNEGYELEIVSSGDKYDIYKIGIPYATVAKDKLQKYLRAYKLFSLKGDTGSLDLDYISESSKNIEDTFCKGEIIKISVKNLAKRQLIVLTIDENGRVIMPETTGDFVRVEVKPPYDGIDRVKLFAFKNTAIYNKTLKYQNNNEGVLSTLDVQELYELLKKEKSLKGQGFIVRTTSTCER